MPEKTKTRMVLQGTYDGENWITLDTPNPNVDVYLAVRSVPMAALPEPELPSAEPPAAKICRFCELAHAGHCSVVQKLGEEFFDSEWATHDETYDKAAGFLDRYFAEKNAARKAGS